MGIPFKFHLESFWNLGGNSMEIPLEFHWESVGIILEFPWNFPGIPLGIHGNPQEWHIPTIPADSQWNSNIPWDSSGICRNSWRRVKYCTCAANIVEAGLSTHTCLMAGMKPVSICLWGLETTQLHVVEQLCCNTHHILVEVTFTHASAFINAGALLHADAFHLWSCRPAST